MKIHMTIPVKHLIIRGSARHQFFWEAIKGETNFFGGGAGN